MANYSARFFFKYLIKRIDRVLDIEAKIEKKKAFVLY
jgi:hypothetical protein